jgi:hypothetical protein
MQVLPIPSIPPAVKRYTNETPPAGLMVLAKPNRVLPPAGSEGSGLPPATISPYSGIYDENGKLPTVLGPGATFIARV